MMELNVMRNFLRPLAAPVFVALALTLIQNCSPSLSKAEVESIVAKYITENTEQIYNALSEYQTERAQAMEDERFRDSMSARQNVPIGSSPVRGDPDAPITIVEFSDFQCPFCARALPTLEELEREHGSKLKIVFKHFPLSIHENAPLASRAALAAGEQGKFWDYHDMLLRSQTAWADKSEAQARKIFLDYAKSFELDLKKFEQALDSEKNAKIVTDDFALGASLGVQGTPAFFVNGVFVNGARSASYFNQIIRELEKESPDKKK